ncbi:hypothetical protein SDC9_145902 [bioreactor metagenome]|uniref:Uncharacterized protein n=1 Tax=bioreactor metagenome TaxID=1076179 RepID=A0A645ED96_9ZZZZ
MRIVGGEGLSLIHLDHKRRRFACGNGEDLTITVERHQSRSCKETGSCCKAGGSGVLLAETEDCHMASAVLVLV